MNWEKKGNENKRKKRMSIREKKEQMVSEGKKKKPDQIMQIKIRIAPHNVMTESNKIEF